MCDKDFLMCDVPKGSIDLLVAAWDDFKRDPGDIQKFKAFDWIMNVAISKWQAYSDIRRVNGV